MKRWFWPNRRKREDDLNDEIESHLRMAAEDHAAGGNSAAEERARDGQGLGQGESAEQGETGEQARLRAQREFGNVTLIKEVTRDMWGWRWLETLMQDVRYGLRQLRRSPGFTLVAVLTLALGIGANTAIFSLLDSVVLRSLPVEKPEELVQLSRLTPKSGGAIPVFTNPLWEQIRDEQNVFSGLAAWGNARFDLARGGEAQYARGIWVNGDFFSALGVRPAAGRMFAVSDDERDCAGAAVLSYNFWQEHFGGDPSAVRSSISLDDHTFPVIGVSAPGFYGVEVGSRFDVALPICATQIFDSVPPRKVRLNERGWWWLHIVGRPKSGTSTGQLKARLEAISPRIFAATVPNWAPDDQQEYKKGQLEASPVSNGVSGLRRSFEQPLQILMAVVGVVLLIACANIASLMLARSTTRLREMAVRRALGASRVRLIRQLLTECVLISSAGALAGILFARWAEVLLVRFISTNENQVFLDLSLDPRILGFTVALALLTGIVFGVLPAFRAARVSLTAAMKGSAAADGEQRRHFRPGRWIVATQVALSLMLVMCAGLFLRSFVKLVTLDTGFDRTNVLIMHTEGKAAGAAPEKATATWDEIERRVASVPGVVSASRAVMTPISGSEWDQNILADSPNPPTGEASDAFMNSVSPAFFRTLHIVLMAGRTFNTQDTADSEKVAVINQTLGRKFYPGLNPIGRTFQIMNEQGKLGAPFQIVGVVGDSKYNSLREETPPTIFFALAQHPGFGGGQDFLIRTAARPAAELSLIQSAVAQVDKSISLDFNTLDRQVDDSLVQERVLATLSAFFGGLALLLAMVGLYGAISYMVTQRRIEFGIRMALGAQRASILRLVMRDVAVIVILGVIAGTGISYFSAELIQKFLFGLGAHDLLTMALAAGALAIVACIAGYLPARRATKVDPMVALRYE